MKRSLVVFVAVAVGLATLCFGEADPEMVVIPGKGKVAFINTTDISNDAFAFSVDALDKLLYLGVEVRKGEWKLGEAKKQMGDATAAVFLVKDKTLPISLIALEEKWGVVNGEGLSVSNIQKEVVRVTTVVLGGASSKYPASAMRPAFSAEDLNKVGTLITIDSLMAIFPNLELHGFQRFRKMDREEAVEQGLIKDDKPKAKTGAAK